MRTDHWLELAKHTGVAIGPAILATLIFGALS